MVPACLDIVDLMEPAVLAGEERERKRGRRRGEGEVVSEEMEEWGGERGREGETKRERGRKGREGKVSMVSYDSG